MSIQSPTPRQSRLLWAGATALAGALLLALLGVFLWGFVWVLERLSAVLLPMGFAMILAYILDPVVGFFERRKMRRVWAVCLVFFLAALIFVAGLGSVLPGLVRESGKLARDLPANLATLRDRTENFLNHSTLLQHLPEEWRPILKALPDTNSATLRAQEVVTNLLAENPSKTNTVIATNAVDADLNPSQADANNLSFTEPVTAGLQKVLLLIVKWITIQLSKLTTWAEFFIGFILVPVYLFYFLLEKEKINRHWTDYLPIKDSAIKDEVVFVVEAVNDCMIVFFRGQVLVALCVGFLLAVGYSILGLNYAVLLGVVAGVLGIVPYLGTITSLVLALLVATVQFGDWTHPMLVLAIAAGVKLLEDFIISPKIVGERAGLHPLTTIVAVLVGTTLLGGFIGAMLAIPLTAALRTLMFRYVWTDRRSVKSK